MASITDSGDVEQISLEGAEASQCLKLVQRMRLDDQYNGMWKVTEIYKMNKNRYLREQYNARRAEMGPNSKEMFAFACAGKEKVLSIAREGVLIRPSRNALGDTKSGLNLCRWSDVQLKAASECKYSSVYLLVFKIAVCKLKRVEAKEDNDIPPDPDFDCHISKDFPCPTEPISDQLRKSQIYLYEFDGTQTPVKRPRQVFPLVVINFVREKNAPSTSVAIPSQPSGPVLDTRACGGFNARLGSGIRSSPLRRLASANGLLQGHSPMTAQPEVLFAQQIAAALQSAPQTGPRLSTPQYKQNTSGSQVAAKTLPTGLPQFKNNYPQMTLTNVSQPYSLPTSTSNQNVIILPRTVTSGNFNQQNTRMSTVVRQTSPQINHPYMPQQHNQPRPSPLTQTFTLPPNSNLVINGSRVTLPNQASNVIIGMPNTGLRLMTQVSNYASTSTNYATPLNSVNLQNKGPMALGMTSNVLVKDEQNSSESPGSRQRPMQDSIDLTIDDEIDESNVIEIKPLDDSDSPEEDGNDCLTIMSNSETCLTTYADANQSTALFEASACALTEVNPTQIASSDIEATGQTPEKTIETTLNVPVVSESVTTNTSSAVTSTSISISSSCVSAVVSQASTINPVSSSPNDIPVTTTKTEIPVESAEHQWDPIDLTLDLDDVVEDLLGRTKQIDKNSASIDDIQDLITGVSTAQLTSLARSSTAEQQPEISDGDDDVIFLSDVDIALLNNNAPNKNTQIHGLKEESEVQRDNEDAKLQDVVPLKENQLNEDGNSTGNPIESPYVGRNSHPTSHYPSPVAEGPKSPFLEENLNEMEALQEDEEDFEAELEKLNGNEQVFRVQAKERRPDETIYEGTVFKVGDDGSVELVIERYFIRNDKKFVITDDLEEEESQANSQNCDISTMKSTSAQIKSQVENSDVDDQEDKSSSPLVDDEERPFSPALSSVSASSSGVTGVKGKKKKSKKSKCPFVQSSKRKRKTSKTPPARPVCDAVLHREPLPEPEKRRIHGRRVPVDINKLREAALAKDSMLQERGDEEEPIEEHNTCEETKQEPIGADSLSTESVNSLQSETLQLSIVDVRSEGKMPLIPKVEIDTAEDLTFETTSEIEYNTVENTINNTYETECKTSLCINTKWSPESPEPVLRSPEAKYKPLEVKQMSPEAKPKSPKIKQKSPEGNLMKNLETKSRLVICIENLSIAQIKDINKHLRLESAYNKKKTVSKPSKKRSFARKSTSKVFCLPEISKPAECSETDNLHDPPETQDVCLTQESHKDRETGEENASTCTKPKNVSDTNMEKNSEPQVTNETNVSSELHHDSDTEVEEDINTPLQNLSHEKMLCSSDTDSDDKVEKILVSKEINLEKQEAVNINKKKDVGKKKSLSKNTSEVNEPKVTSNTKNTSSVTAEKTGKATQIMKGNLVRQQNKRAKDVFEDTDDDIPSTKKTHKKNKKQNPNHDLDRKDRRSMSTDDMVGSLPSSEDEFIKPKKKINNFLNSEESSDDNEVKENSTNKKVKELHSKRTSDKGLQKKDHKRKRETTDDEESVTKVLKFNNKLKMRFEAVVEKEKQAKYNKSSRELDITDDRQRRCSNSSDYKMKSDTTVQNSSIKPSIARDTLSFQKRKKAKIDQESKSKVYPKKKLILKPGLKIPCKGKSLIPSQSDVRKKKTSSFLSCSESDNDTPDFTDSEDDFIPATSKQAVSVHSPLPMESKKSPMPKEKETPSKSKIPQHPHYGQPVMKALPEKPLPKKAKVKPTSKLEQYRVVCETQQPQFKLFKPQKQNVKCDVKETVEKLKKQNACESNLSEDNMQKAIAIYKKNPSKPCINKPPPRRISSSDAGTGPRRQFKESDKLGTILQDMMKNEEKIRKKIKEAPGISAEGRPRLSSTESSASSLTSPVAVVCSINDKQRTNSSDSIHPNEQNSSSVKQSITNDLGDNTSSKSHEIDPASENNKENPRTAHEQEMAEHDNCADNSADTPATDNEEDIESLYKKRDHLIEDLAKADDEPKKKKINKSCDSSMETTEKNAGDNEQDTALFADSDFMKSWMKERKKESASVTKDLFNCYAQSEEKQQENDLPQAKQTHDNQTSNVPQVQKNHAIQENASNDSPPTWNIDPSVLNEENFAMAQTILKNIKSTRRHSVEKSEAERPRRTMQTVQLATSEQLALLKQIPPRQAAPSTEFSAVVFTNINDGRYPDWLNRPVPCQRRRPKRFRPKNPNELALFLEEEKTTIERNLDKCRGRICELKKMEVIKRNDGSTMGQQEARKLEEINASYRRELDKLNIDREIVSKELAICTGDPVLLKFSRLPDDILMQKEVQRETTAEGTPLYTLQAVGQNLFTELQTFKLDIICTKAEIERHPNDKEKIVTLRNQLKWLYDAREKRLSALCNPNDFHLAINDISYAIGHYGRMLHEFKKIALENAERILYLTERIDQLECILTCLRNYQMHKEKYKSPQHDGSLQSPTHRSPAHNQQEHQRSSDHPSQWQLCSMELGSICYNEKATELLKLKRNKYSIQNGTVILNVGSKISEVKYSVDYEMFRDPRLFVFGGRELIEPFNHTFDIPLETVGEDFLLYCPDMTDVQKEQSQVLSGAELDDNASSQVNYIKPTQLPGNTQDKAILPEVPNSIHDKDDNGKGRHTRLPSSKPDQVDNDKRQLPFNSAETTVEELSSCDNNIPPNKSDSVSEGLSRSDDKPSDKVQQSESVSSNQNANLTNDSQNSPSLCDKDNMCDNGTLALRSDPPPKMDIDENCSSDNNNVDKELIDDLVMNIETVATDCSATKRGSEESENSAKTIEKIGVEKKTDKHDDNTQEIDQNTLEDQKLLAMMTNAIDGGDLDASLSEDQGEREMPHLSPIPTVSGTINDTESEILETLPSDTSFSDMETQAFHVLDELDESDTPPVNNSLEEDKILQDSNIPEDKHDPSTVSKKASGVNGSNDKSDNTKILNSKEKSPSSEKEPKTNESSQNSDKGFSRSRERENRKGKASRSPTPNLAGSSKCANSLSKDFTNKFSKEQSGRRESPNRRNQRYGRGGKKQSWSKDGYDSRSYRGDSSESQAYNQYRDRSPVSFGQAALESRRMAQPLMSLDTCQSRHPPWLRDRPVSYNYNHGYNYYNGSHYDRYYRDYHDYGNDQTEYDPAEWVPYDEPGYRGERPDYDYPNRRWPPGRGAYRDRYQ